MATAAILAGIDAREWAGETLFTRNGTNIAAPAAAGLHDGGHYPDAVALLNGWAAYRTLGSALAAQWSGVGAITTGIDSDGLYYVQLSGIGATAFTVTPGTSDPWGWGGTVSSVSIGGAHRATATRAWTRGPFTADDDSAYTITQGFVTELVPAYGTVAHSLPTWITGLAASDNDAVTSTLEAWDNAAIDAGTKRFRWGVDLEGRVFSSWPDAFATHSPVWASSTFRNALGFTGSEVAVTAAGVTTITGTFPAFGVLILRNGMSVLDFARAQVGTAFDVLDGSVAYRSHATWREVEITAQMSGGVGFDDSKAFYRDEEQQFQARVSPYLYPGARATVCPQWGDPRIGMSIHAQLAAGLTVVNHSNAIRADVGGILGRRRCQIATDADRKTVAAFSPGGPRTRTSASWRVRLLDG